MKNIEKLAIKERKKYWSKWRTKNRDKIRQYQRKWRAENKDKVNTYHKKWRTNNVDKVRNYAINYWIRKAESNLSGAVM